MTCFAPVAGAPGRHRVTEQAKIYWNQPKASSKPSFRLAGPAGGAMASRLGRRVVHTSMTADRHVTITLSPQAGPAATPPTTATVVNGEATAPAATPKMQPGAGGEAPTAAAAAATLSPNSSGHMQPAAARPAAGGASSGGTPSVSQGEGCLTTEQQGTAAAASAAAQQAVNAAFGVRDVWQSGKHLRSRAAGADANRSSSKGKQLVRSSLAAAATATAGVQASAPHAAAMPAEVAAAAPAAAAAVTASTQTEAAVQPLVSSLVPGRSSRQKDSSVTMELAAPLAAAAAAAAAAAVAGGSVGCCAQLMSSRAITTSIAAPPAAEVQPGAAAGGDDTMPSTGADPAACPAPSANHHSPDLMTPAAATHTPSATQDSTDQQQSGPWLSRDPRLGRRSATSAMATGGPFRPAAAVAASPISPTSGTSSELHKLLSSPAAPREARQPVVSPDAPQDAGGATGFPACTNTAAVAAAAAAAGAAMTACGLNTAAGPYPPSAASSGAQAAEEQQWNNVLLAAAADDVTCERPGVQGVLETGGRFKGSAADRSMGEKHGSREQLLLHSGLAAAAAAHHEEPADQPAAAAAAALAAPAAYNNHPAAAAGARAGGPALLHQSSSAQPTSSYPQAEALPSLLPTAGREPPTVRPHNPSPSTQCAAGAAADVAASKPAAAAAYGVQQLQAASQPGTNQQQPAATVAAVNIGAGAAATHTASHLGLFSLQHQQQRQQLIKQELALQSGAGPVRDAVFTTATQPGWQPQTPAVPLAVTPLGGVSHTVPAAAITAEIKREPVPGEALYKHTAALAPAAPGAAFVSYAPGHAAAAPGAAAAAAVPGEGVRRHTLYNAAAAPGFAAPDRAPETGTRQQVQAALQPQGPMDPAAGAAMTPPSQAAGHPPSAPPGVQGSAGVSRQDRLTPSKRHYEVMVKADTQAAPLGASPFSEFSAPAGGSARQTVPQQQCAPKVKPPQWTPPPSPYAVHPQPQHLQQITGHQTGAVDGPTRLVGGSDAPLAAAPATQLPGSRGLGKVSGPGEAPAPQAHHHHQPPEVIDCTSDNEQQVQADSTAPPVPAAVLPGPTPPVAPTAAQLQLPSSSIPAGQAATMPALEVNTPATACVGGAAAAAATVVLPSGLQLVDSEDPMEMEQQLNRLIRMGLRASLSSQEYTGLMRQPV